MDIEFNKAPRRFDRAARNAELEAGMRRYGFLGDAFKELPLRQRVDLIRSLDNYMQADVPELSGPERGLSQERISNAKRLLLKEVFTNRRATETWISYIRDSMAKSRVSFTDLPVLFNDEAIFKLISTIVDSKYRYLYSYQLGALLSQVKFSQLGAETQRKLAPRPSSGLEVGLDSLLYLCPAAEIFYLDRSLSDNACVLVNGALLVKMRGKFAAFCIENMLTPDGHMFVAGNWYDNDYSDNSSLVGITQGFDRGDLDVTVGQGKWNLVRMASFPIFNVRERKILGFRRRPQFVQNSNMSHIRKTLVSMATFVPMGRIGKYTRAEYRNRYSSKY